MSLAKPDTVGISYAAPAAYKQLPILNDCIQPFETNVFDNCSEGACGNCGLCCRVMEKIVPSVPGDAESPPITVPAGRKCPQLLRFRGRFFCALYPQNGETDTRPEDCKNWNGTNLGIAQMLAKTEEWILNPASREEVAEIQELIDLELFQTAQFSVDSHSVAHVLQRYLVELTLLPHDIFHMIGIRNAIQEMDEVHVVTMLQRCEIHKSNPLHREFLDTYVGPLGMLNSNPTEGYVDTVERRLSQKRKMPPDERIHIRRRLLDILMRGDKNDASVQRASILIHEVEMRSTREELGSLLQIRDLREERRYGP